MSKSIYLFLFVIFSIFASTVHAEDDAFNRIIKTNTLRCGYMTWPPLSQKNPKTDKMEGMYIDLTEELAKGLGWKVEWIEEVALSDFVAALNTGRIDMMCAPLAPVIQRVKYAYFTLPHLYGPFRAYVREGDKRFDGKLEAINDATITISTMEGELTSIIARTNYPKAKVMEISQQQGAIQLFENVAAKKADVVFQDPFTFASYNEHNKEKLRQVVGPDIGFFSANYAIKFGEDKLLQVINAATQELINRRYIEQLAKNYHLLEAGIYLPADGFKK
jgi:polar amino acid transport system substrate-binding protein